MTAKTDRAIIKRCKAWDKWGAQFGWAVYGYMVTPTDDASCTFWPRKPDGVHYPGERFTITKQARDDINRVANAHKTR
mgnify:CR=1 FL=1